MSTSSINSQLSIMAPASSVSIGPAIESNEFDRILSNATKPVAAAEKTTPLKQQESKESESSDGNNSIEVSQQEQTTSREDQNDPNNTADEQPVVVQTSKVERKQESEIIKDEVLLSDAVEEVDVLASKESKKHSAIVANDLSSIEAKSDNQNSRAPVNTELMPEESINKELPSEADETEGQPKLRPETFGNQNVSQKKAQGATQLDGEAKTTEKIAIEVPEATGLTEEESTVKVSEKLASEKPEHLEQLETSEEVQSKVGVDKPVSTIAAQQSTVTEIGAVDHEPRSSDNNSATANNASSVSDRTLQPSAPPANQPRTELSSSPITKEPVVPEVDRGRFVHRVANAFRSAQQQDGQIQLRLSPPELGALKLEIAVRHGVLTAKLETETVDARRALLDNLPALRQRLAEQDIRIDKFEVDIRRDNSQSQNGAEDRQFRKESHQQNDNQRNRDTTQAEVAVSRVSRSTLHLTPESLDVRI